MTKPSLGQRIAERAEQRGWSHAELARRVGIEKSHLSRLISGERNWQIDQVERVARAFEEEPASLLRDTGAEGLMEATQDVQAANVRLTDQLARQASENEVLRGALQAAEGERDALRAKLAQTRQDLQGRPTKADHDALHADVEQLKQQAEQASARLADAQRGVSALEKQVERLKDSLKKSHVQVQANHQAYKHWRKQAESNGNTLKGVAYVAAGMSLIKLLGGSDEAAED